MQGGGAVRGKPIIIILILMTFILFDTFFIALAENGQTVWNGYDLVLLNTYDVQLVGQNSTIEIYEDKLVYSGEYIIKNKADKTLEVILGLPSINLENIQIIDKGNALKYYKRNGNYIEDKYPSEAFPKVDKWHTYSLWLKNDETKIINLKYESKLINNSKGVFSIRFNKNKGLINSEASMIVLVLNNFYPYNVLDTTGVAAEKTLFGSNNQLILEMNKNSEIFGLDYELVDKLSIDRLDFSANKKLKNIATLFRNKDYDVVNALSDEYIDNPGDPSFDTTQVKYVKAEAYRKRADFEKYIEGIKGLDLDRLYPNRLKYKILYDLDRILEGESQDSQILGIIKLIQAKAFDDNEYIDKWMRDGGKDYINIEQTVDINSPNKDENEEDSLIVKTINFFKLGNVINKVAGFKYLRVIVLIMVFMLGYYLGRRTKKRKNTVSYYTFKR